VELDVWRRQILTVQADRLQAQLTISRLNSELLSLLDLPWCLEERRVWNPEGYRVTDEPIDIQAAVTGGLARRPELLLLRLLICKLDAGTLPAVHDVMRSIHPLLGSAAPPGLLRLAKLASVQGSHTEQEELTVRRQQLEQHLRKREAVVASEIRQAAAAVQIHAQSASLARERARSWEAKVLDIEARQKQGLASFAELTSANLEWLKARGDIIQETMAWEIAGVQLRQAQGLLPPTGAGKTP
jgi:outer membrane protein TolC